MMNKSPDRDLVPLETLVDSSARRRYWQSLDELAGLSDDQHAPQNEFAADATDFIDALSRRRFLQLSGASLALAGLAGCTRQPVEMILPYIDQPENVIPGGRPLYYATAVPVAGILQGVLVESHMGRPTKIEGNPDHPASLGATSVQSQASVLDLYDPDRSKEISHSGNWESWDSFVLALRHALVPIRAHQGEGLHILTETITSPTLGDRLLSVLEAFPQAKWHQYDPAGPHSARLGAEMVFGRPLNTYYNLEDATVVLALDSDFLACGQESTRLAHDFASRRTRGDRTDMNRLYAIETSMTATGGKSDHRLRVRYAEVEQLARELAAAVGVPGIKSPGAGSHAEWMAAVARDLKAHPGQSAIIAGVHQSPAVHALAHALNAALGNVNKTVIYTEPVEVQPVDQIASIRQLAEQMHSGKVELLLILGGNPVYNAPLTWISSPRSKR